MFHIQSFTLNPVHENTYILYNESRRCIIIDPGAYFPEEKQQLLDFIETESLSPALLLNTHCHLDHVFANRWVHEKWGLSLHIHPKEKPVLDFAPAAGLMWEMPFDNYNGELIYIREGESIGLDDDQLEILFTPGHSPGSVCFYCRAQHFVIGGDVLFQGSVGRTDLPMGSFPELENSIRTQLYTLPDETLVYPGHGPSTNILEEKLYNQFVKALRP